LIAIRNNKIVRLPLMECVEKTHEINRAIQDCDFDKVMDLRGSGFRTAFQILRTLTRALPHEPLPGQRRLRIGLMNAGGPSPGMNAAMRAAVRLAGDQGHVLLGVRRGFRGLIENDLFEMKWMSVSGWAPMGGSELGTSRKVPTGSDFYAIAKNLEEHEVDALLIVGGLAGYIAAECLLAERDNFPAFKIPIVCVPASINNNLPSADHSIGADTALNSITDVVDKIKQSAVASNRCFVVEVMGRYCGYLALMSALATGAERVYLHEEGIRLVDLEQDIAQLIHGFTHGKRLGLMVRNERANPLYTTQFLAALFEEEGGDLFDVRISVLGHLQQGGDPSPYDRILAVRLADRAVDFIENWHTEPEEDLSIVCCGYQGGELRVTPIEEAMRRMDREFLRPKKQWWMELRPIAKMLATPGPQ
jgi:6-phosphofructokinase 1